MTDLVPTREHTELATSVRKLLEKRSDSQAVRRSLSMSKGPGFDTDLWSTLCEQMGVAALAIPEESGGAGFTLAETYVVLEELGCALTPSPLLASVIAGEALSRTLAAKPREGAPATPNRSLAAKPREGAPATPNRSLAAKPREGAPATEASPATHLLERIAAGTVATLAWSGVTGTLDAPVGVTWKDGALTGKVSPVLYGDVAEILLVVAEHSDGVGLFTVDPAAAGLTRTRVAGLDPTLSFANLAFDNTPAETITLDATDALARTHRVGTLAVTALQVGCAQRGLDMTVEYAKQREQFGRTIGSFQALKHRMADLLVRVQMSRAGAWAAVQADVNNEPNAERLAAAAGSYCADAAMAVGAETIQLHGGIAITWEHDAHLVFKRAQALNQLFGLPHQQRAALVD